MIGLGRAYGVTFDNATIANASGDYDLFYIKPAADKICIIESVNISNVGGTADAGDAQEELLRVALVRLPATVTASSGGAAPTPTPISKNDTAASFTARTNDSTVATTSGTAVSILEDGWNVRIPYVWMPPPEHRILVANAEAVVFRLRSTVADDIAVSGSMMVRELP